MLNAILWAILIVFCCGGMLTVSCLSYYDDKNSWNNGISPSGKPWKYWFTCVDVRAYEDGEGNFCWIWWFVDK